MLTPAQARDAISSALPRYGTERVAVDACVGRVLHEPVTAERDQPPFDRVMMDGIAARSSALEAGLRRFRIEGTQHAGDPALSLREDGACIEIMTGAVLPDGADTIIPVERVRIDDGHAELETGYTPAARQFIHPRGSDHTHGTEVLQPGTVLSELDVAILASCGLTDVEVAATPAVRIISTGSELVPSGTQIEPHQIRLSNGPALVAMLRGAAFGDARHDHLIDEPAVLEARIGEHLSEAQVLVLSGGVSMGKADFVPETLARLGVKKIFHRISQRPGKPMWFGTDAHGKAVFALPGNPVSALVCCRQYVLPALLRASGRERQPSAIAVLQSEVSFAPDLTCFLPVTVRSDDNGRLLATPKPTNTSGDFTSLSGTDGYVELDAQQSEFPAGLAVPFHAWSAP